MSNITHQPHKVFVAEHWADDWVEQDGVYCDFCTFAVSPAVNEAQLSFKFGYIQRAGSEKLYFEGPKSIDEWYVKVEIGQGSDELGARPVKKWVGVVVQSSKARMGKPPDNAQPGGKQTLQCRGLEYLFQRTIIDKSWVLGSNGNEKEIQRAIGFNLGSGDQTARWREPNRAQEFGTKGVGLFDVRSGEDVVPWTAAEAVKYLLAYYPPQDRQGDAQIEFTLDPGFSDTVLQALEPAIQVHGKNLKQVLDELIDRRRLVGWKIEVDENEDPVVKVFTFNKSDIDLPDDKTILKNPTQTTVYFDSDASIVGSPKLTSDPSTRYDLIIARGERLGACCTVSSQTGSLDKDWTDSLKTDYQNAATASAGYGALSSPAEKTHRNANYRLSDKFQKVYRYFRLSLNWDGKVSGSFVCPDPNKTTQSATFWVPGLRFKPQLPLLSELDYQTSATSPNIGTLADSKAEYRRPFAVAYHSDKGRYYFLDKLGAMSGPDLSPETNGLRWSVSVRMHDDHCAIILDVAGTDQHVIAKNDFTAAESAEVPVAKPVFDWKQIYATVFCEFDHFAEQTWPQTTPSTDADQLKRLIIDVPRARLDYLAPGTIIGLDASGQPITAAGGYVRDNRDKLKDVARGAYEWYGQTRQSLEFTQRDMVSSLDTGTLITDVGSASDPQHVNTVVTQMQYDLVAGTITVRTQFAELDLLSRYV